MSSLLRAFYILTYLSLASSTLIFVLSMLDLGFASLWTNPVISGLTIVYHIVILVLQRRECRSQVKVPNRIPSRYHIYPTSKVASLVCAFILASIWSIPIAFTTIAGVMWNANASYQNYLFAGSAGTVMAQFVFDVLEFVLMFSIAAVSTRMRVVSDRWAKSQQPLKEIVPPNPRAARSMRILLRTFYILTYASLVGSMLVFILSMLDLGYASLWTSPTISGMTIIYHIVILVLQRNKCRSRAEAPVAPRYRIYPTSKVASLVFAYLFACIWIISISFIGVLGGLTDTFFVDVGVSLAANRVTVLFQLIFSVIDCLLLFAIAAISTRMRVLLDRWARGQNQVVFVIMPSIGHAVDDDRSSIKSSSSKHAKIDFS